MLIFSLLYVTFCFMNPASTSHKLPLRDSQVYHMRQASNTESTSFLRTDATSLAISANSFSVSHQTATCGQSAPFAHEALIVVLIKIILYWHNLKIFFELLWSIFIHPPQIYT